MALALVGCGGGEEEAAVPAEGAPPAEGGAPVPAEAPPTDRSAPETSTVFEPFPTGESVPSVLGERVEAREPTLILFIDSSQDVTNEVRGQVDKALRAYRGLVGLVMFDLGKYTSIEASGQVVVDGAKLTANETASQAVKLARELGVNVTPYILMVDDQAHIVFRHRGLVDAAYLEMHMERLAE
jgi:hypothetical protein